MINKACPETGLFCDMEVCLGPQEVEIKGTEMTDGAMCPQQIMRLRRLAGSQAVLRCGDNVVIDLTNTGLSLPANIAHTY
jgi:hypothetical protein